MTHSHSLRRVRFSTGRVFIEERATFCPVPDISDDFSGMTTSQVRNLLDQLDRLSVGDAWLHGRHQQRPGVGCRFRRRAIADFW